MRKRLMCVIRFDDICPTMDWENFRRAMDLMKEYGIKPLLGVVPDNRDTDLIINEPLTNYWDFIKKLQADGIQIAMHGFTHVYDKDRPFTIGHGFKHSEFAGNSYENQCEKIKKGKRILEEHGIYTDVFFAPAHTYDLNTLRALRDNGFRYLSDGMSKFNYIQCGIMCIPCRSSSVPMVRGKSGIYTSVSHPSEWRNPNKVSDYDRLIDFCCKNKESIVTFADACKHKPVSLFFAKIDEFLFCFFSFVKKILRRLLRIIHRNR